MLSSAIKLSRAGLRDPDKPIGNYLFTGPTGVGKTEVARQLASIMGIPLQRFDMSRVYGAAFGQPADRRAAGLCRLRSGRSPDRRDRSASALRAAARRDREGASRPVQHPPPGDGQRQADRPPRQDGRFQERHPDHDHQCRRQSDMAREGIGFGQPRAARTSRRSR